MSWNKVKVGDFLIRVKDLIPIEKDKEYSLVTIKLYHKGVQLRKREIGSNISADKMSKVKSGQFILSGIDARNGAFGIIPPELDGAVVTNDFWHFDIDECIVSKEYFLWLTSTPFFDDICNKASDGTTNRIRLQADRFYTQELFIPDIDNQHEVVEELKKQDSIIDSLKKEYQSQLTLLSNLNQAILQEAVQGKLVPQDPKDEPASELLKRIKMIRDGYQSDSDKNIGLKPTGSAFNRTGFKPRPIKPLPPIKPEEIPFEIPENWVWCRLGDVSLSISTGPFGTMLHQSDYIERGIPLVNPMNIVNERISPSDKMMVSEETAERLRTYILKTDDVVIGRRGEMGRCAVVTEIENGWLCGTGSFFLRLHPEIYRLFFIKVLRSDFSKSYLLKGSVGATMNNLNHRILSNLPIPLPPLSEQKRIVAEVEKQFALTQQLKEHITQNQQATEQLLKALLHQAFEVKEMEEVNS